MTISLPQVTLPEQVTLSIDKVRSVDWQKRCNQAVIIAVTIAAWITVIAKRTHQAWQIVAPQIIRFCRFVADSLEALDESPPPPDPSHPVNPRAQEIIDALDTEEIAQTLETSPPLQIQQDLKHLQKTTPKSRAPKRGFQN